MLKCLVLFLVVPCLLANLSPVRNVRNRQVMMKRRGAISPNEVVDYIRYLPGSLDDMDFSRCDPDIIEQILNHLPAEAQAQLKKKLQKDAMKGRQNRMRRSTDGTDGITAIKPRFSVLDLKVDELWARDYQHRAGRKCSEISPMMVGESKWNWQRAFFNDPPGEKSTVEAPKRHTYTPSLSSDEGEGEGESEEDGNDVVWRERLARLQLDQRKQAGIPDTELFSTSSEDSDEEIQANMLRAFIRSSEANGPSAATPNRPIDSVYFPPSQPRKHNFKPRHNFFDEIPEKESAAIKPRLSSESLIGFADSGGGRYTSPTRNDEAQRRKISRENSSEKARLSRETLIRTASQSITSQRFRGIVNTNSLCYISSVIQALFHIPAVQNAMLLADNDQVRLENRKAFVAFWKLFDGLGRFVDQQPTGSQKLEPLEMTKEDVKLLSAHHDGQGDASEVIQHILEIAGPFLEPLFKTYVQETIMEDRPTGFIYGNKWQPTTYLQFNVLDHDYRSLQEYVEYGIAEAVEVKLDPTNDARHREYMATRELEQGKKHIIPSVKYANIIKPSEILCFHLVRYSAGGRHNNAPRLGAAQVEYPEELKVLHHTYQLQSVVVHEALSGFGNQGHYYTLSRTHDEKEPWVECNDSKVTVISKHQALAKTNSATLLFYVLKHEDAEDTKEASRNSDDFSKTPFIAHDLAGSNLLRSIIQDAVTFSHDFRMKPSQNKVYMLYQAHGFSKQSIRQALAITSVDKDKDMVETLKELEAERKNFALEKLLQEFPESAEVIPSILEANYGDYKLAHLELMHDRK